MRFLAFALLVALAFGPVSGCKKSSPGENSQPETKKAAPTPVPAPKTVASIHSLGLKQILADTNAAGLKTIWDLPETVRLKDQTLDKLAIAAWRQDVPELQAFVAKVSGPSTNQNLVFTNYAAVVAQHPLASKLRPLLEDLLQEEVYFETRASETQPGEILLAARLDENRSSLWQSNLQSVLETVSGVHSSPTNHTFTLHLPNPIRLGTALQYPPATVSFSRLGAWSLLLISPQTNSSWGKEIAARIQANPAGIPFKAPGTNSCLEVEMQPQSFAAAAGFKLPLGADLAAISFSAIPNSTNLLTVGKLQFSKPLPEFEKWTVPVSLIHEPLFSFTAIQGLKPWLAECAWWKSLQAGEPPNQFFLWTQAGSPFLVFAAAPLITASNAIAPISDKLIAIGTPVLSSNRMGALEHATNFSGIVWSRAPLMKPFLEAQISEVETPFLFAGLAENNFTNHSAPAGTISDLLNTPNLLFYNREITGARVESLLHVAQLFRLVFRRAQLPTDSATLTWFKAVIPKLGPATTKLLRSGPMECAFERTSQLGLGSLELHLFADWFESPTFPSGFHTLIRELPRIPAVRPASTNVPPAGVQR